MPSRYEPGALLEVRGETWTVTRAQPFEACAILTLEGRDRSNAGDRLRVIEPIDQPRPIASRTLRRRSRRAVITAALAAIVNAREPSRLWTAAQASIELWPYQLEPALAVIGGATRLLLADAVGLGKTIQAGLILAELIERGWIEHALIVCPAGLRETWARELRDRFHIAAAVLDQQAIADRIASLPPGVSPWSGHAVAIASIDLVKRADVLSAIDGEPIDLLIADEVHHLAPGTDRGAAVSRLASRAPWCVFVSATPHSGDRAAFDYLTSLGDTGDPIAIFRRHRGDVGLAVARRSHLLAVMPTREEAALLAAIEAYARAIWAARGRHDRCVRLIAMTMARRAASSRAAIVRTLSRRLALLSDVAVEATQSSLPWEEVDRSDDVEADAVLSAQGLENGDDERRALQQLVVLATCCSASSKIRRLQRLLDVTREPAVIFTEYRDTLDAVAAALSASGLRISTLHGGLSPELRRIAVDTFNGGGTDVLVATDAAGEGLNLHHRCRLVVDIELPWNPLRLEQRVGRVDRLGQARTVHAIRLFHPGTIESAVLDHLHARGRRAADAFAPPLGDRDVASAIFDGIAGDPADPDIRCASIEGASAEADRIAQQRRHPRRGITGWTLPRRQTAALIALHRVSAVNDAGCLIGERLQATRVQIGRRRDGRRRWRTLIAQVGALVTVPRFELVVTNRPVERRVTAIRARLKGDRMKRYQRSLFDNRADVDAAAREAIGERLDAALARTLRAVIGHLSNDASRAELMAVWPESRR